MIRNPFLVLLAVPFVSIPLILITIRNYPEVLDGVLQWESMWPWSIIFVLYLASITWVLWRYGRHLVVKRRVARRLSQRFAGFSIIGPVRAFGLEERPGKPAKVESQWLSLVDGSCAIATVSATSRDYRRFEVQDFIVRCGSVKLDKGSLASNNSLVVEAEIEKSSTIQFEVLGPWSPVFGPSASHVLRSNPGLI